jgi:glycoprotein-N-acetylgalactosamine 3-beta-galactosyltransferase
LSREALKRVVENAFGEYFRKYSEFLYLDDPNKCERTEAGSEDVEIGKCLENVGVVGGDSRDKDVSH